MRRVPASNAAPTVHDLGRRLVLGHHIGLQSASTGKVEISCAAAAAAVPARLARQRQQRRRHPGNSAPRQDRLPAGRRPGLGGMACPPSSPPLAMPCAGAAIEQSRHRWRAALPGQHHIVELAFARVSSVRLWSSPYSDMVAGAEWEEGRAASGGGAVPGVGRRAILPFPKEGEPGAQRQLMHSRKRGRRGSSQEKCFNRALLA